MKKDSDTDVYKIAFFDILLTNLVCMFSQMLACKATVYI